MRRCLLVLSLGVLGCLSPTMPLPPPSRPEIDGPDGSGRVVLSGRIPKANSVYVDNLSTGYSAGQALDPESGAYRFSMAASVGNRMSMFYRVGATDSEARLFKSPRVSSPQAKPGVLAAPIPAPRERILRAPVAKAPRLRARTFGGSSN
ncbi:MAG: hypothetical protein QM784_36675 [Polyangiaceae bacterium]